MSVHQAADKWDTSEQTVKRLCTNGEIERLNEAFTVAYTYNFNAIEGNTLTLKETDLVLSGLTIDKNH
ncbi:MAG: hypothetical protein Q4F01_10545 [Staphylococcus rostri]|uniref:hypothetical protein n=1 Tax=Staphylococcus rostri TaxID=522262 RepID=UPI0026DF751A|nr:hypothetical protein [Staphylococcus rostri]MDO5376605.1 hypothetical protein [Staphylococcus rostri]